MGSSILSQFLCKLNYSQDLLDDEETETGTLLNFFGCNDNFRRFLWRVKEALKSCNSLDCTRSITLLFIAEAVVWGWQAALLYPVVPTWATARAHKTKIFLYRNLPNCQAWDLEMSDFFGWGCILLGFGRGSFFFYTFEPDKELRIL